MMKIIPTEKKYLIPIIIFLALNGLVIGGSLITALLTGQFILLIYYTVLYLTASLSIPVLVYGFNNRNSLAGLFSLLLILSSLLLSFLVAKI